MTTKSKKELSPAQFAELIEVLKDRFHKNMHRHQKMDWLQVQSRLEACFSGKKAGPDKLWSLNEMEITGGEPDVVGQDVKTGEYLIYDCSAESPKGRRSLCYDKEALAARKEHKPKNSAIQMATEMGIEVLTEDQYRTLQKLEKIDPKTSSWLKTPPEIRKLDGAIFGDNRYDHIFIYHNGVQSYYAARGFRGWLAI